MKKALLLLAVAALVINGAGCKKKAKPAKKTEIIETLDVEEIAGYRNPKMTKELM